MKIICNNSYENFIRKLSKIKYFSNFGLFILLITIQTNIKPFNIKNEEFFENAKIEDVENNNIEIQKDLDISTKPIRKYNGSYTLKCGNFEATMDLILEHKIDDFKKKIALIWYFTYYKYDHKANIFSKKCEFFNEFEHPSFYKAKRLLIKYWLFYSNFWTKDNFNENLIKKKKEQIKDLKSASIKPLKIFSRAMERYSDVIIITENN